MTAHPIISYLHYHYVNKNIFSSFSSAIGQHHTQLSLTLHSHYANIDFFIRFSPAIDLTSVSLFPSLSLDQQESLHSLLTWYRQTCLNYWILQGILILSSVSLSSTFVSLCYVSIQFNKIYLEQSLKYNLATFSRNRADESREGW